MRPPIALTALIERKDLGSDRVTPLPQELGLLVIEDVGDHDKAVSVEQLDRPRDILGFENL